jgi:hypothetical protein
MTKLRELTYLEVTNRLKFFDFRFYRQGKGSHELWVRDSETIKPRLQTLSIEQLELFGESLFDFESFEDAITWLNNLN